LRGTVISDGAATCLISSKTSGNSELSAAGNTGAFVKNGTGTTTFTYDPTTELLTEVAYPNVRLEWQGFSGIFTAKLADGKLSGTWRQGPVNLPLQCERSKE